MVISSYRAVSLRPESWVVPVEAVGRTALLQELVRRRLFDPALAASAMTAPQGAFCWPDEGPAGDGFSLPSPPIRPVDMRLHRTDMPQRDLASILTADW